MDKSLFSMTIIVNHRVVYQLIYTLKRRVIKREFKTGFKLKNQRERSSLVGVDSQKSKTK